MEHLEDLVKRKESQDFDRILTSKNPDALGYKISAFASAYGGVLLIGQDDYGKILDVGDEQSEITRIGEVLRNCEPIPTIEGPFFGMVEGKKLAWLRIVSLGKGGPCFYKNTAYMRIMDSDKRLSANEIYRIWARTGRVSFELRQSYATEEGIDREVLDFYLKKARERGEVNESNFMETRHLKEAAALTNLGVVVLSKRPADFLPRPVVTLIRFRGSDPKERIAATTLSLPLHKLIPACENFILLNLPVKEKFEGMRRIEQPTVPVKAIREALVNAIAHRDYESSQEIMIRIFDDRVEFSNPGAPDSETLRLILEKSLPVHRNPLLYEFLRLEGFGEGAGQGIVIMRAAMHDEALPEPKFQTLMDIFVVTLYSTPESRVKIAGHDQIISIARKGPITSTAVMHLLTISRPTAIKLLNSLVAQGILVHVGERRGSTYLFKENVPQEQK